MNKLVLLLPATGQQCCMISGFLLLFLITSHFMCVPLPSAMILPEVFIARQHKRVFSYLTVIPQFADQTINCYYTDGNEFTDLEIQIFTH